MKIEGIDHVAIVVKDMDKTVQFLSKLFELEFEETPFGNEIGLRICTDRPGGQIELLSVADPVKAAKCPPIVREVVELALKGWEGIYMIFFRVKDMGEAVADAERKGVRIAHSIEGKQEVWSFIHHFKEATLNDEDMPIKHITLVNYPKGKG